MCKGSFIKEDVVYLIIYLFNNIVNTFLLKVILESGIPLIRQKTNIINNKIQNKQTKHKTNKQNTKQTTPQTTTNTKKYSKTKYLQTLPPTRKDKKTVTDRWGVDPRLLYRSLTPLSCFRFSVLHNQGRSMTWKTGGGGHKVISKHVMTKTYLI